MTCSHCPHCRAAAASQLLQLAGPPVNYGRAGVDMAFYLAFARAYDRARAVSGQPMRLLRNANPWLTESQCKSYLKRARALQLIGTPSRGGAAVDPVAGSADPATPVPAQRRPRQQPVPATHPLAGTILLDVWNRGDPVMGRHLRSYAGMDADAAERTLQQLVAIGGTRDGDQVAPPVAG